MKTSKVKVLVYKCPKCHASFDFLSDREFKTKCKVCGNDLVFSSERDYNPESGLRAVKSSRKGITYDSDFTKSSSPTIECPYCKSTNTKKISGTERVLSVATLGLFSKKINKSFKCKNCSGTF